MTREEFSTKLKELRKESGVLLKRIYAKMDVAPIIVTRIENATGNYTLKRALSFLDAINAELYLYDQNYNCGQLIESDVQALAFLEKYMKGTTSVSIADNIGLTKSAVGNIRNGKTVLTIDPFLRISEFFNLKVIILSK